MDSSRQNCEALIERQIGEDESGGESSFSSKNSRQRVLIRENSLPRCSRPLVSLALAAPPQPHRSPTAAPPQPHRSPSTRSPTTSSPTHRSPSTCSAASATDSGSPREQQPDDESITAGRPGSAGHGGSLRERMAGDAPATTGRRVLATGGGCPRPSLEAGTRRRYCHSSWTRRWCAR